MRKGEKEQLTMNENIHSKIGSPTREFHVKEEGEKKGRNRGQVFFG